MHKKHVHCSNHPQKKTKGCLNLKQLINHQICFCLRPKTNFHSSTEHSSHTQWPVDEIPSILRLRLPYPCIWLPRVISGYISGTSKIKELAESAAIWNSEKTLPIQPLVWSRRTPAPEKAAKTWSWCPASTIYMPYLPAFTTQIIRQ